MGWGSGAGVLTGCWWGRGGWSREHLETLLVRWGGVAALLGGVAD